MTAAATTTIAVDDLLLEMLAVPSRPGANGAWRARSATGWPARGFDAEIDPAGNVVAVWGDGPP